ncbi:hypothetical protein H4R20_000640 [Coemansia guatemalensis]|uniref:UBR-type domain-containing protein n=1 Tax=Coemansia guatemalensis TaxID=2761395 RepID=A0A9W8LVN3_9FUNG|nr:hypothetical protein H4R20_000640 [Coemansia guatemalensis]
MAAECDNRQSSDQAEAADGREADACVGDDSIVTACGYLTAQADLEREAAEVLSGKFDECTYDKGYIHQPLYACLTCTRPPNEYARGAATGSGDQSTDPAGMCYSCSIECHSEHEVIELFTKRHFRCDCGTRRLLPCATDEGGGGCSLKKTRVELADLENRDNAYGHNFWGFYCRCDKYYDPSIESGLMVQCYICNDWYHDACIGTMPDEERYDDYICRECVSKHAVVRHIRSSKITRGLVSDNHVTRLVHDDAERTAISDAEGQCCEGAGSPATQGSREDESDEPASKKPRSVVCRLRRDLVAVDAEQPFDMFMADGWKADVCTCIDCMREIEACGLMFLIKEEAVVEPEEDETRSESLYESALKQLRTMDHTRAMDAATAYSSLSSRLKSYLQPFAASGKIVTGQDIRAFFDQQKLRCNDADL